MDLPQHDTAEALAILIDGANRLRPGAYSEERSAAASALLRDFTALVKKTKHAFYAGPSHRFHALEFGIPDRPSVLLGVAPDGSLTVSRIDRTGQRLELIHSYLLPYDPIRKQLTSYDLDETVAPRPGEPRPRRSALAVFAEAAVRHVRIESEAGK